MVIKIKLKVKINLEVIKKYNNKNKQIIKFLSLKFTLYFFYKYYKNYSFLKFYIKLKVLFLNIKN